MFSSDNATRLLMGFGLMAEKDAKKRFHEPVNQSFSSLFCGRYELKKNQDSFFKIMIKKERAGYQHE